MNISREAFDEQRRPRFGSTNPERMKLKFWEWMIRGDEGPTVEKNDILGQFGFCMQGGILKSSYGPYRIRKQFDIQLKSDDGPIWTFDRMGSTRTELPDGRMICIGGEHEDSYDPDFCIYNDVIVLGPGDQIEIYGYPNEIFPPTDFHTASLVGDDIIIVGCLGYGDDRRPGHTPVYRLDLASYQISVISTTGQAPGWLFRHEAEVDANGTITVRGGEITQELDIAKRSKRNIEEFTLDTGSWIWRQMTNRNWRQFLIRQAEKGFFALDSSPGKGSMVPTSIEYTLLPCDDWNRVRFVVQRVSITVFDDLFEIEVTIEGDLSNEVVTGIVEEIRANVESKINRRCVVEQI